MQTLMLHRIFERNTLPTSVQPLLVGCCQTAYRLSPMTRDKPLALALGYLTGGYFFMAQAEAGIMPQQGVLLRRAHELLESFGKPVSEDLLLQHLFGVSEGMGKNAIWLALLRKALRSSSLFEQADQDQWALLAWRSTQQSLNAIEFVILDTETTG